MKDKHQKHPKLKRPVLGHYHKVEWAVYGTTCDEVEAFYNLVEDYFKDKYRLSYIDADHSDGPKASMLQIGKKKYAQNHVSEVNSFDDKFNIPLSQAAIINGNHFSGERQLIIINPKKRNSLLRRVDQLTKLDAVIIQDESSEIYDFVQEKMDEETKIFVKSHLQDCLEYMGDEIERQLPQVKALILAGGKSTRMKEDKSQIIYHEGQSQEEYMADLVAGLGLEVCISKSETETRDQIGGHTVIKDRFVKMGPFGAILSAFMYDPEAAWLVLACDLPYLNKETLEQLLGERSILHFATAIKVEENPFPEPLIAIYEPAIYQRMLQFMTLGYACPRKVLINSEVKHVILDEDRVALNVNTPEERAKVIQHLKSNT